MNDQIIRLLAQKNYVPANVPELLLLLRLAPNRQQELQAVLQKLEHSGVVARIKGNRYVSPREADLIPGRIRMNRAGRGFLQPDDSSLKEIAVSESSTGTALHEDRVLVRRDVRRPANLGDKVVVELREWESRHTNPEGEIIEVLGAPDAEGVDMLSVLRQYDLPLHFPKPVLAEAQAIGSTVDARDFVGRLDCRSHQVVTIDPDDAKDFDDAICLEKISPEQWRLLSLIHI